SVQNAGIGGITAVAGWDGLTGFGGIAGAPQTGTVDFADFVAAPGGYGNVSGTATGTIYVGDGNQTAGIAVGSRGGATSVFGDGVRVSGGNAADAYAQLGYRPTTASQATSGDLN